MFLVGNTILFVCMKNFSFVECQKFIEAIKIRPLALGINAKEIPKYTVNLESNWVIIAVCEDQGQIIVPESDGNFISFIFKGNHLEREISLDSYSPENGYVFSIFEVDTFKVLAWLRSDTNSLTTEYEEVSFEVGWRIRKSFFNATDVIAVVYFWQDGPMLVCCKEESEEQWFFSDPQESITQQSALQAFRGRCKSDTVCMIKVLHLNLDDTEKDGADTEEEQLVDLPIPASQTKFNPAVLELSNSSMPIPHDISPNVLELSNSSIPTAEEDFDGEDRVPTWTHSVFDDDTEQVKEAEVSDELEDEFLRAEELEAVEDDEKYKKYTISSRPTTTSATRPNTTAKNTPSSNRSGTETRPSQGEQEENNEETISTSSSVDSVKEPEGLMDLNQSVILPTVENDSISEGLNVTPTEVMKNTLVSEKDIKILSGFGIFLPKQESSSSLDIQQAYTTAIQHKQFRKDRPMGPMDKQLFRRLELPIHMEQKIREIKIYLTIAAAVIFLVCLQILGSHLYEKYQIYKGKKEYCYTQMSNLEAYCHEMENRVSNTREILATLAENYPVEKGYPEPGADISAKLEKIQLHMDHAKDIQKNVQNLWQVDIHKLYEYLCQPEIIETMNLIQKSIPDRPSVYLTELEHLQNRCQQILEIAKYIKKTQDEDSRLFGALLVLRECAVVLEQKNKVLQENWNIIQNKYQESDTFPSPPEGVIELIQETKTIAEEYRKSFTKLQEIMVKNREEALFFSKDFSNSSIDTSKIDSRNRTLDDHIAVCQSILKKRILEQETLDLSVHLQKIEKSLREELEQIRQGQKVLSEFPKEFNVQRPDQTEATFLKSVEQQTQELSEIWQQSSKLFSSSQVLEAKNLLLPLAEKEFNFVKLRQVKTSIQDAIKIAQITKTRWELGRKIAGLLQVAQENLLSLDTEVKSMEDQHNTIIQKYSKNKGFPSVSVSYQSNLKTAKTLQKNLQSLVDQTDQQLKRGALDDAIKGLEQKKSLVDDTKKLLPKLQSNNNILAQNIEKFLAIDNERKQLAQLAEKRGKIESYLEDLRPLWIKFDSQIKEYEGLENPKDPIPGEATIIRKRGQEIIQNIEKILVQGEEHKKQKEYELCQKLWEYENLKELLNRDYIALELNKYQGKMEEQLRQTKVLIELRHKKEEIKAIIVEIETRKQDFQTLTKEMVTMFPTVKQLASSNPEYAILCQKDYDSCLEEARIEVDDIEKVIEKTQANTEVNNYDKALERIRDYSVKNNPSGTKIGYVRAVHAKFLKIVDGTTKIPKVREESEIVIPRIPDEWYNEILKTIAPYEKLDKLQLRRQLQDRAGMFHDRLDIEIANLKRIPQEVGELDMLIKSILAHKGDLEKMLLTKIENSPIPRQAEEAKQTLRYFKERKIPATSQISEFLKIFQERMEKFLQDIAAKKPIGEEQMKELFKSADRLYNAFQDEDCFRAIHSTLATLEAEAKSNK